MILNHFQPQESITAPLGRLGFRPLFFYDQFAFVLGSATRAKDFHLLSRTDILLFHDLRHNERHIATRALRTLTSDCVSFPFSHLPPPIEVSNPNWFLSVSEFLELMDQHFKVRSFVDILDIHVTNDALLIHYKKCPL